MLEQLLKSKGLKSGMKSVKKGIASGAAAAGGAGEKLKQLAMQHPKLAAALGLTGVAGAGIAAGEAFDDEDEIDEMKKLAKKKMHSYME